ncbi:MAG: hypothetical protein NTV84_10885, partial [Methanoregula sp.]|nr:hypothetical protein [Methanoregula sp.]
NQVYLARSEFRRDQVLSNCVGVNPVVDFGQIPADIPAELLVLFVLESLKFRDKGANCKSLRTEMDVLLEGNNILFLKAFMPA